MTCQPYRLLADSQFLLADVSDSMQNLILQHSSIDKFLKHYLDRNINVDVQSIYRGLAPQKILMRFACSMSRSIDARRPRKLTTEQSASVNRLPCILKLDRRIAELPRVRGRPKGEEKCQKFIRRLRNEKQRQRRLLLENLVIDRFKKQQPIIDSERQLSGKVVDEETRDALERSDQLTPEHLILIDAILTLPETSVENETRRRIKAITAVTAYCSVEEGPPLRRTQCKRLVKDEIPLIIQTKQADVLSKALRSIKKDERPTICFLCLGNPSLTLR
jgi:hypothetical protein